MRLRTRPPLLTYLLTSWHGGRVMLVVEARAAAGAGSCAGVRGSAPLGMAVLCGCSLVTARRVGLSPELAYPLPTTDQEMHQIRMLVCQILAAAAEDGKLLLPPTPPTTDHTSAPLQADTYSDTTPPPRAIPASAPPPPPLSIRQPTHVHHRAHPWAPRHGPPPPAQTTAHAGHGPTRRAPLTTPNTGRPAHTHRMEPQAPRHAQPAKWPAHAPRTHPHRPRPTPPGPQMQPM